MRNRGEERKKRENKEESDKGRLDKTGGMEGNGIAEQKGLQWS